MLSGKELLFETYNILCKGCEEVTLPQKIIYTFGSTRVLSGYSGIKHVHLVEVKKKIWIIGMGMIASGNYDLFALPYYENNHQKTVSLRIFSLNEHGERHQFNLLFVESDGSISVANGKYTEEVLLLINQIEPFINEKEGALFYHNDFPHFLSSKILEIITAFEEGR